MNLISGVIARFLNIPPPMHVLSPIYLHAWYKILIQLNLRMILQEKRRLFFIYILIVCLFIAFRIYIISISSVQCDIPNGVNRIKNLASMKYCERRSKIQDQCKKGDMNLLKVNADPKWKTTLFFDYENNLIYCGINKVSSTTWTTNLMKYVN